MTEALSEVAGDRLNEATLDKVVRNASSSWQQSGHLRGRSRKTRQRVRATRAATAYALLLGFGTGSRGCLLFETPWCSILDATVGELLELGVAVREPRSREFSIQVRVMDNDRTGSRCSTTRIHQGMDVGGMGCGAVKALLSCHAVSIIRDLRLWTPGSICTFWQMSAWNLFTTVPESYTQNSRFPPSSNPRTSLVQVAMNRK